MGFVDEETEAHPSHLPTHMAPRARLSRELSAPKPMRVTTMPNRIPGAEWWWWWGGSGEKMIRRKKKGKRRWCVGQRKEPPG